MYRTRDAAETWQALSDGLPQSHAHVTVLRDAFTCDGGDPAGLWFGTRSGEVYASFDEGDHWELIASHLPQVTHTTVLGLSPESEERGNPEAERQGNSILI